MVVVSHLLLRHTFCSIKSIKYSVVLLNKAVEAVGKPLEGQSMVVNGLLFHFACADHSILNIGPQRH